MREILHFLVICVPTSDIGTGLAWWDLAFFVYKKRGGPLKNGTFEFHFLIPSALDMFSAWQTGVVIFGLLGVTLYTYRSRRSKSRQVPLPPGPSVSPLVE